MFAKRCRILHTSRIRKRRHKDPSCVRAPSVALVIVVPHYEERIRATCDNIEEVRLEIKVSSYIAQYPALGTTQSALIYTLLLWQIDCLVKQHLTFSGKYPATLQLICEGCLYKYPSLSIVSYILVN